MSAELLINITPQESRAALLENGILQEVLIERTSKRGMVGNIYKGKVSRVLPGMEAAFVDIGLEKAAFLHASDLTTPPVETFTGEVDTLIKRATPKITDILYEGKKLLVQVIKDPLGTKGARLTTYITLPSRFLVLMPDDTTIGVSSKIESTEERDRLRALVTKLREELGYQNGYIVRTAAEGISEETLRQDMAFLRKLWSSIEEAALASSEASLLYSDLPLVLRVLRDMVGEPIERVLIDSRETAHKVREFSEKYIPDLATAIEHYPGERPIFDLHGVEEEIQKSLQRKVPLKSGGYLIVDQTEAMTTIDVNTGGFVGSRNLEETIFRTNLEAAQAIARQLRLRNLGGIIILDFIDMNQSEHRQQVMKTLEKALEKDYAKTYVCDVSPLGLVEMTRKRTRESLEHVLCESCPTCQGRGYLKTAETVCYELFREILRAARQFEAKELLVLASQEVIDMLVDEESDSLLELQEFVSIPIRLQVEVLYTQEQFDVVLL
ncbi:ribonuclease G [Thiolinea disciformis]|uniref:ribonuclease G n=1 Tax=Thiolinea disciformis TaxID=125614 RepID=UPI00035FCB55|nr:ribonuclease G [Thiolinea disciformis]